jgi:F0F1-type ATP synthase membrane subunit b/b'
VALADLLHWLQRFRAPPGRPARALGAPAKDAELELELELESLLAQLDAVSDEAASTLEDARLRAQQIVAASEAEASEIVASARREAQIERARAAESWIETAEAEGDAALRAAREEAVRIREQGEDRIPAVVASLLRCVEEGGR